MAIKKIKGLKLSKGMYKNMPFIAFLAVLAMLYIANAHQGEKIMREIQVLEKDAKEERWRYMSVEADLMKEGRRSEIQTQVSGSGLQMPVEPPKELIVNN